MEVPSSLLPLLLALGALWTGGDTFETDIIGGHEAAPHSRPYMASLQKADKHVCGGVLVDRWWVLTAAHCVTEPTNQLRLKLGLHRLGVISSSFRIQNKVLHPDYKPHPFLENDLALLKLDRKVKPSKTVRSLALPRKHQAVAAGAKCSVAGWGRTQQGGGPAEALQELDMRVIDAKMCNNSRFWNGAITPNMICLEAKSKNQDPCKGDSGGPLVCRKGQVAGILSFSSPDCIDIFKPPVATALTPRELSWIKKTIKC